MLEARTTELHAAIAGWNKNTPPPRDVTLLALYVQRAVRLLGAGAHGLAEDKEIEDETSDPVLPLGL